MKCSVFIATSLDGYIARDDGSIDWLIQANELLPKGEDCGYHSFISTVDAIIMGRHSFEKVLSFEPWPYPMLPVIVLSQHGINIPERLQDKVFSFSDDLTVLLQKLSTQGKRHLYIDGGITIQRFLAQGLIDEIIITIIPILLGQGRHLFGELEQDRSLKLVSTRSFDGGLVQMHYRVLKADSA